MSSGTGRVGDRAEPAETGRLPQPNCASPAPFIVGTGRSGTTLLRMMLDSHSQLAIPPETNFDPVVEPFEREGPRAAVETLTSSPWWPEFGLEREELAGRVDECRPAALGDFIRLFYELYAERRGKRRWGDKSPYYVRAMRRIYRYLPEARFIHVIRDGRDVALSITPLWFGPDSVAESAKVWVDTIEVARRQAEHLPHYIEIRYEDLVRDPAGTLQGVCDYLDLTWEPGMLDYHRGAAERFSAETVALQLPDRTLSRRERLAIHSRLALPPQGDRLERWRREMSAADRRIFEAIAAQTLDALGYALRT